MKKLHVEIETTEMMLGTASANPELHEEYIASKAPDAQSTEEEVASLGVDAVFEKGMTVFPRNEEGKPIIWDYQIRGMFKDACGMMRKIPGTKSAGMKAFKKEIDGLIFVEPRKIPIAFDGEMGICQRPLRASTPQGERVALASSESIPAGAKVSFDVRCMVDSDAEAVKEWLEYGQFRGLGQWRNSGMGRFTCKVSESAKGNWND